MTSLSRSPKRLRAEQGSALPLTIGVLAVGLSVILIAAKVGDAVLVVEQEQLLADSTAWRYAKDGMVELAIGPLAKNYDLIGARRIRVEVRLLPDARTVSATACDDSGLCASSKARSASSAPPL